RPGSGPGGRGRSWHAAGDGDVQAGGDVLAGPARDQGWEQPIRDIAPGAGRAAQGIAGVTGAAADLEFLVGDGVVDRADGATIQVQPGRLVLDVRGGAGGRWFPGPDSPPRGGGEGHAASPSWNGMTVPLSRVAVLAAARRAAAWAARQMM